MFNNIGSTELIIILIIIILLFGASKIPALARSLGKSVKEFKNGMKEGDDETPKSDKPKDQSTK